MKSASLRPPLLANTALATLLAMSFVSIENAAAQDQIQEQEQVAEEIVITGSRIARDPNAVAPVPVQSVSGDDIQLSGNIDLGEVLNDIPALLTSSTSTNSVSGIFSTSVGQSVLQLRGLGTERTLVLVDGRRHVAGVAGEQSVDIGSIPQALIERVEVLTGGASAIYGADAVTGVVNFILKDDFEGFDYDVSSSISDRGDGEAFRVSTLYGQNFAGDRGNFTIGLDYSNRDKIFAGDRPFSRNNGIADDLPNPALRFQHGDISAAATPNFARFYDPSTSFASTDAPCSRFGFNFCFGFFDVGLPILSQDDFINLWRQAFPGDPDPQFTEAELALIERATNSPSRVIRRDPRFSISSAGGVLLPGSIFSSGVDIDNNGTDDCFQSFVGLNGIFDFSPPALGFAGGCWVIQDNGTVRPYQDGAIVGEFNQFGGDGIPNTFDEDLLIPDEKSINVNFTGRYDLTPNTRVFTEAKFTRQTVEFGGPLNTFYDLLTIAPDNPYIDQLPDQLADLGRSEGLFITRDPADLGPNINKNTRKTYRIVLGFEGELENGWTYELTGNYGKFQQRNEDRNRVIVDRWFAAIDAVRDPDTGEIICRSDIDPSAPPTTPFGIPVFEPGFFTFNPGDGQCQPANILGGRGGISQEAIDFITTTTVNRFELEQAVFSAVLSGDTSEFVELSGGPIGFAFGAELRSERSISEFDPLIRGVIPVDTPDANEGELVSDIFDGAEQNSLVFDPGSRIQDVRGSYDVVDFFAEASAPLLQGAFLAEELTVDAAFRYSDYSTVGSTLTWKAGGSWAPVSDIRFRGTYSVAVRAPNIDELFSPAQGAFFRPVDPCAQSEIDALISAGDPRGPIRQANCRADGIPQGFADPLSARFVGEISGNPELQEETAKTFTVGTVIQPRWIPGLTLTADYWRIRITDAITSPSAQDVVDSCYDSASFPDNPFCELFTRNNDPTSPQFQGFNFLRLEELNVAALESAGIDIAANYAFTISDFDFNLGLNGTKVRRLDEFFDPSDLNLVDPELGELQRPEWAGNVTGSVAYGPVKVNWQTQYLGKQGLRSVEIETANQIFGPSGIQRRTFIHDISFTVDIEEYLRVYGGVNNLADKEPFITEAAFPVSPLGRSFFLGVTGTF